MRQRLLSIGLAAALAATAPASRIAAAAEDTLRVTFVDVEGGQATLFALPSGESLLVDAGYPGYQGRDADRIAAAAKRAGLTRIDYLVVTHYHTDHAGGVTPLAAKLPIRTFIDHGPSVETGEKPDELFKTYAATRATGRHIQVEPGDTLPIKGLDIRIVSAAGDLITKPLANAPQAGAANPLCAGTTTQDDDPTENARSVGMMIAFGRFRMIDLGDLTWNKERGLACPANLLGTVDVYLTTHHGLAVSGSPVLVHALKPRVAIMNNGATKGGAPEAWQTVRTSPGLEDFYQLHTAVKSGADRNVPAPFIANLDESTAHDITLTASRDGSFIVTNGRTGESRTYKARQ